MTDFGKLAVADAHCDTATRLNPAELAFGCAGERGHLDFPRLQQQVKLQFMAFFLRRAEPEEAWSLMRQSWRRLQLAVKLNGGVAVLEELALAGAGERPQLLLAVEGLDLLGDADRCRERAEELWQLGIRSLGLFWNNNNFLGCGADAVGAADTGLTAVGREFAPWAEERGFLVDLAHASQNSFWQAAEVCRRRPLFVSHACCAGLCPHRRNLTDEQLRALGESGGWLGITLAPDFLRLPAAEAELEDVVRHLLYAVNKAGLEAVGLGSDFDGVDVLPRGLEGVQSWPRLAEALAAAGLSEDSVERLLGGNLLGFLQRY